MAGMMTWRQKEHSEMNISIMRQERDTDLFKSAMRQMASTISLVTTSVDGRAHGMIATSIVSVSAEPPSLLVCINRSASMHGPTSHSGRFCVNMLGLDQAELCREFGAREGGDRFEVGRWGRGLHDLPFVEGAVAVLFCSVEREMNYATHTIFVGRIEHVETDTGLRPLVFQAGSFGEFHPLNTAMA